MSMDDKKLAVLPNKISDLDDVYAQKSAWLKNYFDGNALALQQKHNDLIDFLGSSSASGSAADELGSAAIPGITGDRVRTQLIALKTLIYNMSNKLMPPESVTGEMISPGAVTAEKIAEGAVKESGIADEAVSEGKLADGAVSEGKIANGAVTADKLGSGAVSEGNIAAGVVSTGKLADGAVTGAKISDGQVGRQKLTQPVQQSLFSVGDYKWNAAANSIPGWLLCDGSPVYRANYPELFALIGTTFGDAGDSAKFLLPNIKGRVLVGVDLDQGEFNRAGKPGGHKLLQRHEHLIRGGGLNLPFAVTVGSGGDDPVRYGFRDDTVTSSLPEFKAIPAVVGGDSENLQPYLTAYCFIKY